MSQSIHSNNGFRISWDELAYATGIGLGAGTVANMGYDYASWRRIPQDVRHVVPNPLKSGSAWKHAAKWGGSIGAGIGVAYQLLKDNTDII
ncbi:MAG: hypothetical protein N2043_02355 [Ignavibacterium sp.]|nr:hypothetical protein [Ignavibacterium sp.]